VTASIGLSAEAVAVLEAGVRDLPMALLGGERPDPGTPLRLLSPEGPPLGLALADPENDVARVMALAAEGLDEVGPELWRARVHRALARRREIGVVEEGGAWRALHGAGDATPGFMADVFGEWAVVYALSEGLVGAARALAGELIAAAGLRGAVVKERGRGAAQAGRVRQHWVGERTPERLVVRERGVPFEVHLDAGLNVGLFTDMRDHRHGLALLVQGGRVLNLFAYTGTLSVVAARSGAQLTSVDLSAGVLDWARDNFRLSGLDPAAHAFVAEDAGRFLNAAIGAGQRFDAVLVDPPTFSSGRGAEFALERDYPGLVARAAQLMGPGGRLWLACNARGVSLPALAREGLRRVRRSASVVAVGGLPADHPTLLAQPEDRYLHVATLVLG
jgi:23S rRNA (cytosine1962-C5)-methyltransferase